MKSVSTKSFNSLENPIDEVEEILFAYGVDFLRINNEELSLNYKGIWNIYEMSFQWVRSSDLVQINTDLIFICI